MPIARETRPRRAPRSLVVALALLGVSCYQPGDLGLQPYACSANQPECPAGYACDSASHACEHPCPDGSCPDGTMCDAMGFCVVPCASTSDCAAVFGDSSHACSSTLQFCVPAR
jgi:hypothetical protein